MTWETPEDARRDFGGHVFGYEHESDLYRCIREGCGKYAFEARDSEALRYQPCEGK